MGRETKLERSGRLVSGRREKGLILNLFVCEGLSSVCLLWKDACWGERPNQAVGAGEEFKVL